MWSLIVKRRGLQRCLFLVFFLLKGSFTSDVTLKTNQFDTSFPACQKKTNRLGAEIQKKSKFD